MTDFKGRSLLVTGGAGFVGSHLVDQLIQEGVSAVHVVDNLFLGREENLQEARAHFSGVHFHKMDATDGAALRDLIRREHVDVVFNLATKALGYSFDDPADAFHVNTQITGHLLESLRKGEIGKLVHFSSSEAYGSALTVPMSESHPLLPHTPYAAGKAGADLMIHSYHATFGTRVLVVRPFNNFGPRQNTGVYAGVVPITMLTILRGEAPVVNGTGEQTRDFLFVKDTVRLTIALSKRDDLSGATINLATGIEISIREVVKQICAVSGYKGPVLAGPARAGDVLRHCADVKLLTSIVGTLNLRTFASGLAETWEWYKKSLAK